HRGNHSSLDQRAGHMWSADRGVTRDLPYPRPGDRRAQLPAALHDQLRATLAVGAQQVALAGELRRGAVAAIAEQVDLSDAQSAGQFGTWKHRHDETLAGRCGLIP